MFNVYGHKATERDDNQLLPSDAQYNAPEYIVYTTEDEEEAKAIVASSGFVKDEEWYVATRYDGEGVSPMQSEFIRPLDADPLPENSAATIEEDGTVKTDDSMRPMEKTDVDAILEYEAEQVPEKGRNDQPGFRGPRKILP